MVRLIPSKMFIKDPVDAWGDEKTIGLSEHSARRLAPPITQFMQSGNIVLWDGYEDNIKKYSLYQVFGGTAERSIDYAQYEAFSLKCTPTGGAASHAGAKYYLTDFHEGSTMLVKASVTSPQATGWAFSILIAYYDGTNVVSAHLKYAADGSVTYYDSAGVWQSLLSIPRYSNVLNWGSISLAIDLATAKYVEARVYREEMDMSTYDINSAASAENPHVEITLYFEDIAGTSIVGYIDDVVVMEHV